MKKVIANLAFLIAVTTSINSQVTIKNISNYSEKTLKLANLVAENLNINKVTITIEKVNYVNYSGKAKQLNDTTYTIYLSSDLNHVEEKIILCHELKHIQQFYNGTLKDTIGGVIYMGILYTIESNYYSRPYEKEAIEYEKYCKKHFAAYIY